MPSFSLALGWTCYSSCLLCSLHCATQKTCSLKNFHYFSVLAISLPMLMITNPASFSFQTINTCRKPMYSGIVKPCYISGSVELLEQIHYEEPVSPPSSLYGNTVSSPLCIPQWHSSLHDLMCIKRRQSKLETQQGLHNLLFDPQKLFGKVIKPSADYYCEAWGLWNEIQKSSICEFWAILQYIKKPEDQLSPNHRETLKLVWKIIKTE